jgi:PAS domain-containing protein
MTGEGLILSATASAVLLALCSGVWTLSVRRRADQRIAALEAEVQALGAAAEAAQASAEAFESALLAVEDGRAFLASGDESLEACAVALGVAAEPQSVVGALMRADPDHALRLRALFERGESCGFEVRGAAGVVTVEGRASGALAWLRLSAAAGSQGLPPSPRFAAFLNARAGPAWIAGADGRLIWANAAWLEAVGAEDITAAVERRLSLDPAVDALAIEAASM